MTDFDIFYMQRALALAEHASELGEVPVGAVVVQDGKIIGEGFNCPITQHDPCAHAEIQALRAAALHGQNYRLLDSTLYVTLEPCTMCVGALIHARVARVVFAATEPKAGSLVSARRQLESGYYNHIFVYEGGVCEAESRQLLQDFFKRRRLEKK